MTWLLLLILWLLLFGLFRLAYQRGRLKSPWHRDVVALGLLALAALGFFWRVVVGQNWMPADGGDLVSFLFPTYRFAAASLQSGAWPLWNPALYGGAPHIGDIQAGFLYPPNLLLFLLKPDFPYGALQWLSIGHIWFAGAGLYLLLARGLRVRRIAALTGALAFMFSDVFLVHFGNLNFNAVASWLPWIFWAFLPIANSKWQMAPPGGKLAISFLGRTALAGVLLAIATLAGHIQATLFIVLALAVYTGLWLWLNREEPQPGRRAVHAFVSLSVCFLVSLLLTAPILLPAFQLTGHTARAGWDYTQAAGYSLSPAQWIGWLIPGFFGRGPQFHWGAWPRVELGYIGVFPLILAGLALALRRERRTWAWAGLAGISFVLALGIYAIPHGWLTLLPGFGQLRAPARLVLLTDFALAALAALGLDAALRPLAGPARAAFDKVWRIVAYVAAATLAIGVPLGYLALLLIQDRDPAVVLHVSIALIAILSFAGLLLASLLWLSARRGDWVRATTLGWLAAGLVLLDLASLGAYQDLGGQDPSVGFDQPAIAAYLRGQTGAPYRIDTRTQIDSLWQPDTALLYGLEDVGGVANPLALADAARYWENLGSRSSRLYDLLNIRYVIAKKDVTLDWDKFALAFDGDPRLNVYENRRVLPRAFVVGQIQPAASHEDAWNAIHAPGFDPATSAVVEGTSASTSASGEVTEIASAPNRLTLKVSADGPALLVISQLWYPGWQVAVDGQAQGAPLRTNYLFQGVTVAAGSHTVELRFTSPLWRIGWMLAGVTAAILLVSALVVALRRRQAHRSA
jgi:hypothetical protein